MDRLTQANAAVASHAADDSDILSQQASGLMDVVGELSELIQGGGRPANGNGSAKPGKGLALPDTSSY